MRLTHDPAVDMAYLYLGHIPAGAVAYTEALVIATLMSEAGADAGFLK